MRTRLLRSVGWLIVSVWVVAGIVACAPKEEKIKTDKGFYYEGPMKPKNTQPGGAAGAAAGTE